MVVAIIGSRTFHNYAYLSEQMDEIALKLMEEHGVEIEKVVSGGANGADSLGVRWATENSIEVSVFKPNYKKYEGNVAPLERNKLIVAAADLVVAFIDPESTTNGTKHALSCARELSKPIIKFSK